MPETKKIKRSDLPFGSEFSPSQISLAEVLEVAREKGGDWKAFEAQVKVKYFDTHQTSNYNKNKLANNAKLGMIAYGIIDRDARLTEFGSRLFEVRQDESKLYAELGKHVLLNLHGMTLVQCVLDLQAAGEKVDLIKLREWLSERNIHFPSGGKHPSIMRLWLERAGVFSSGWQVNEIRLTELTGFPISEIDALSGFTAEQRAYLKTLSNLGDKGPYQSNEVAKLSSATYGIKFNEKNLPKQILHPLELAGYIALSRGEKQPGRGAKPILIKPTAKFDTEIIIPLLNQLDKQTEGSLRPLLRKNISDIMTDLKSHHKHIKGLALEALAFKLMRLLDLDYVKTRLRSGQTGGAEVDLIFESSRLVFSRWQVQCKNTKSTSLDDVAKEVGLTKLLKSNVIVIVTTGKIGEEARYYANKVMEDSNLCLVMIDGNDLNIVAQNSTLIVDIFNREAKKAMRLKSLET